MPAPMAAAAATRLPRVSVPRGGSAGGCSTIRMASSTAAAPVASTSTGTGWTSIAPVVSRIAPA